MPDPCCSTFAAAQQTGTDNEGYGRLIWTAAIIVPDPIPEYHIGEYTLPPINFCPWCGTPIPKE